MAFTSEQNINISVDKTTVGITATSIDFNKLLTDNFNVTVSTNNSTGYVLNMAVDSSATNGATITTDDGSGGTTTQENVATNALVNTVDNKYYLPSITSSITNPTDSTFPTNSWAYSISSTPTNMIYSPLPEAGSSAEIKKVTELTLTEDADGNLTADDVTPVTVATKADMSIPAGAYTNKLIFTAVTNFNPEYDSYTIAYDANGGSGTAIPDQTGYIGEDVTLSANTFSRTGFTFLGWSTDKNATTATYTNGQTIEGGLTNTAKETITLYAVWQSTACTSSIAVGGTCTSNGVTFIKLKDNNLWTKSSQGSSNWSGASSKCPSGTYLPTKVLFDGLIGNYGAGSGLYDATGWSGYYWPSTDLDAFTAWYLYVNSSSSSVDYNGINKSYSYNVVCVKS